MHPYIPVEMFIEWPEGIVDLVIITKEFIEEYCILLGESIYGNVDAALLWLRLLDKYLIKECDMTRIQADYLIFYKKYDRGKLKIVMSINVDYIFMTGRLETLGNILGDILQLSYALENSQVKGLYKEQTEDRRE